jgi:hypothetical protein
VRVRVSPLDVLGPGVAGSTVLALCRDYTATYVVVAIALVCIGAIGSLVRIDPEAARPQSRAARADVPTGAPHGLRVVALLRRRPVVLIQP